MRIVQILESFAWGDAIGNHAWALNGLFAGRGYECAVYAHVVDTRLAGVARSIADYDARSTDIILYHLSTGSDLNYAVAGYPGKLVVNYHNVTPEHFFEGYNSRAAASCRAGREGMRYLAAHAAHAIAVSAYNAQELKDAGYLCPVDVVPILLDMQHLGPSCPLDVSAREVAGGAGTQILFVGRIAPNKRIERVIEDFWFVRQCVDARATLTLAGNAGGMEAYLLRLKKYVRKLGLSDVAFLGHIGLSQLLDLYRTSDVFLCESAHEGFCVPLVEAMHFGLPIVAWNSSAVGDTLGDGGLLLQRDDPRGAAVAIDLVMRSSELRVRMAAGQKAQLQRFDPQVVGKAYLEVLGLL